MYARIRIRVSLSLRSLFSSLSASRLPFRSLSRRSPCLPVFCPSPFLSPSPSRFFSRLPILALPSASPYSTSDIVTCPLRPPLPRIPLGLFLSFLSLDQVPAYYVTLLPRATIFNPETRSNCEFSACMCTCSIVAPSTPPFHFSFSSHLCRIGSLSLFCSSLSAFGKG